MKNRKRKRGVSLQNAVFVCTLLASVLAGAWFLFPVKEMLLRLPQAAEAFLSPAKEQQTSELAATERLASGGEEQAQAVENHQPSTAADQPEAETQPAELAAAPAQTCARQTEGLRLFFSELEQKDYIKSFNLKKPVEEHLSALAGKLTAKPPTVLRETDTLYTVLSNTVHLFRVLGRDNLRLVKTILEKEHGRAEDIAAGLHSAAITGRCSDAGLKLNVPFETAYEYAGFFLNTMGGRAYLFRRDAATRLLASYYAVLVIDEADSRSLNKYGIELANILPGLIREIEATNQLVRKEEYLAELGELAAKHPVRESGR